jgi:hypothetical protein
MNAEHRIVASAEFVTLLAESLMGVLHSAAEAIEVAGFDPDAFTEPLARFDRIRAALDATGWGDHGDVDLDTHGEALQDALADRLDTERHMRATAERDKDEQERQRARANVLQIETFMREAGLGIPEAGEPDA